MESVHIWIAIAGASLLFGCSEWPPQEQELVEKFTANRQDIETLKTMLEESKYETVSPSFGKILAHFWDGEPFDGQIMQQENPGNSDEWARLFERTGLDGIQLNDDGEILLTAQLYVFGEGYDSHATYINSAEIQNEIRRCEKGFADANCGRCIVHIDTDWWIVYGWWPNDLTDEPFDAWMNEEMSEDEFYEIHDTIHNECMTEGGTLLDTESDPG